MRFYDAAGHAPFNDYLMMPSELSARDHAHEVAALKAGSVDRSQTVKNSQAPRYTQKRFFKGF
jgi:hypothetical protein